MFGVSSCKSNVINLNTMCLSSELVLFQVLWMDDAYWTLLSRLETTKFCQWPWSFVPARVQNSICTSKISVTHAGIHMYSDGDRALSGAETVTAHPQTYTHTHITAAGNFTQTHILTYPEGHACRLSPTTVCPSTFSEIFTAAASQGAFHPRGKALASLGGGKNSISWVGRPR